MKIRTLLILALLGAPLAAIADVARDTAAVVETVQRLFDAMAKRDVDLAAEVLLPEGRLIVVEDGPDGIATRAIDHVDFVAMFEGDGPVSLERMWDPVVAIDGTVASLRADYDFHRDGVYSHCGVDLFHLVRVDDDRWRIAGGTFTRDTGVCAGNPLPAP